MFGWWIVVSSQTPEECDRAETDARKAGTLAHWEVGLDGLAWLEQLVQAGKATQLFYSGYPNRYTARAGDVLPLLASGPPAPTGPASIIIGDDYMLPSNWRGKIELHADRIAACPADQVLTIDAWDLS
jgi:hypothetical protein